MIEKHPRLNLLLLKKKSQKNSISEWLTIKYWHVHTYNAFLFIYIYSSSIVIFSGLWQKQKKTKIVAKFHTL